MGSSGGSSKCPPARWSRDSLEKGSRRMPTACNPTGITGPVRAMRQAAYETVRQISLSIRPVRLAAGARAEGDPNVRINVVVDGLDRAVAKHDVHALGVHAVGVFDMAQIVV